MFNELQVGRFNRWAQKLFSLKGSTSLSTMDSTLQIVMAFPVEVDTRYLQSWDRFGFVRAVSAVAAQQAGVVVRNPAGSNVIAVIEAASIQSLLQDSPFVVVGPATTDLGSATTGTMRMDPRGRPTSALTLTAGNAASPFSGLTYRKNINPTIQTVDFVLTSNAEFLVMPGDAFSMWSGTVNQATSFSVLWRERFLEDSERA